ncbi:hypothetical protein [Brucella ovis]|uniref:hypothetical protein n=2 Tax=Brucella ovis TaxID=236 RepID=UPI0003A9D058|nr:hypothetical protein [Brucella ovis]
MEDSGAANDRNTLQATANGTNAANAMVIDADKLETNSDASIGIISNVQTALGDEVSVSARATGGAELPEYRGTINDVITTGIGGDIHGASLSTSENKVIAQASGNSSDNSLSVKANTMDLNGGMGNKADNARISVDLSQNVFGIQKQFGISNAQLGAGKVTASLLNNGDATNADQSASILTDVYGDVIHSTITSGENVLSASAVSNTATNNFAMSGNSVSATTGALNMQVTNADVSSNIGLAGHDGVDGGPFDFHFQGENLGHSGSALTGGMLYIENASSFNRAEKAALEDDGWALNGDRYEKDAAGTPMTGQEYVNFTNNGMDGSLTADSVPAVPSDGGVTIAVDGSTLRLDNNLVVGAARGNVATNGLKVDANALADGFKNEDATAKTTNGLDTQANQTVANFQTVEAPRLTSDVYGSFGISTAEAATISGSTLLVNGNEQNSVAVGNTATNSNDLQAATGVMTTATVVSRQESGAAINASSTQDIFAPAAVDGSTVEMSENKNVSLGIQNDVVNELTVSANTIDTVRPGKAIANAILSGFNEAGDRLEVDDGVEDTVLETPPGQLGEEAFNGIEL